MQRLDFYRALLLLAACALSAPAVFAQTDEQAETPNVAADAQTNVNAQTNANAQANVNAQANANAQTNAIAQANSNEEESADPRTLKAIDLYTSGDVSGAYDLFKKIYDENPDSDPPGVLLALLHSHAGNFPDMRRALEQTAEDYPGDPEAYLQLANIDVKESRFLEALLLIERAEKLLDSYKENCPGTKERFDYLREEALAARANLAERRERFEEAKALTQKALEINPENAQSYWNLGYLSMKLRDYDAAEIAFDEAAKRNPDLWPGWLQVAAGLDRADLVDEGKARFEAKKELVAKAPKDQKAQVARIYLRWNMLDEAREIVEGLAQENDETNIDRWILAGWLALYVGKYVAAEGFFRNATIVDQENFEASNGLALALLDQKNKEKLVRARTIATKNYHAYPDNPEAAVTYAWTLFLTGNGKEANEIFGPMLSSGKMTATVAYYLAEIANTRGDKDMAKTLLRLALSQKSNFPKRAAALELQAILDGPKDQEEPSPFDDFDDEPFADEENEKNVQKNEQADASDKASKENAQ